jgi:hypothetical protein
VQKGGLHRLHPAAALLAVRPLALVRARAAGGHVHAAACNNTIRQGLFSVGFGTLGSFFVVPALPVPAILA